MGAIAGSAARARARKTVSRFQCKAQAPSFTLQRAKGIARGPQLASHSPNKVIGSNASGLGNFDKVQRAHRYAASFKPLHEII